MCLNMSCLLISGITKHGTLRGSQQSHKALANLREMARSVDEGVLQTGRHGARKGPWP